MKYLSLFVLILSSSPFLSSCDTETDEDDLVPPVEDLSNTAIESVTIINVPPYYWDNGSSPDLYLKVSLVSDSDTNYYYTNQVDNVEEVPQMLHFSQLIPISDSAWRLQLLDQDDFNAHVVIYYIIFNPHDKASTGKIPIIIDDLLVMEFNYVKL